MLGAEPVVTTATDAVGLPGLDTLGSARGGRRRRPCRGPCWTASRSRCAPRRAWPLPPLPARATRCAGLHASGSPTGLVEPGDAGGRCCGRRRSSSASGAVEGRARRGGARPGRGGAARRPGCRRRRSPRWPPSTPRRTSRASSAAAGAARGAAGDVLRRGAGAASRCRTRPARRSPPSARRRVAEAAALVERRRTRSCPSGSRRRRHRDGDLCRRTAAGRAAGSRWSGSGRARGTCSPRARARSCGGPPWWSGLDQYVDQIRDLLRPGTRVLESGLGAEEERARTAVAEARDGHAVALIGSGDAGVYAMASPGARRGVRRHRRGRGARRDGGAGRRRRSWARRSATTTCRSACPTCTRRGRSSSGGCGRRPRRTSWSTFYNPRSRGRDWQLPKALAILAEHRAAGRRRSASCATRPGRTSEQADDAGRAGPGDGRHDDGRDRRATRRPGRSRAAWSPRAATAGRQEARIEPRGPPDRAGVLPAILRARLDTSHLPPLTRAVVERVVHSARRPGVRRRPRLRRGRRWRGARRAARRGAGRRGRGDGRGRDHPSGRSCAGSEDAVAGPGLTRSGARRAAGVRARSGPAPSG